MYKLTYKLTETKVHKSGVLCVVLCFGCSCQAMLRQQSTFSGLWNVWIKRLARRPEIGQDTAPEPGALHSMMEDGGSMCLFVLLYTNRIKLVTGLPTELESDLDMPLKWKQEISRSRKSLATGTTLVVRSHFYQVTISIISFRKEFCLDSDWLKIAWDTLRRTEHATCATWATRMCFSLLFIAFHCLDSLDLLRNEHRRGIGRFAAIDEKSTIKFQLNRLNIWFYDYMITALEELRALMASRPPNRFLLDKSQGSCCCSRVTSDNLRIDFWWPRTRKCASILL